MGEVVGRVANKLPNIVEALGDFKIVVAFIISDIVYPVNDVDPLWLGEAPHAF